jgi:hypothetical protein
MADVVTRPDAVEAEPFGRAGGRHDVLGVSRVPGGAHGRQDDRHVRPSHAAYSGHPRYARRYRLHP